MEDAGNPSGDPPPGCRCKIGRTMREHGLAEVEDELVSGWLGDGTERTSVRELARFYNQRLLERAMADAGAYPLDGEVRNLYRLLTDDDASSGMRTDARNRLERSDVDVERIESSFVSYGTVYRHLTDCLGVESPDESASVDGRLDAVTALKNRTAVVGADAIADLRDAGRLDIDEFDVFVDVNVRCDACDSWVTLEDLAERGGCGCGGSA